MAKRFCPPVGNGRHRGHLGVQGLGAGLIGRDGDSPPPPNRESWGADVGTETPRDSGSIDRATDLSTLCHLSLVGPMRRWDVWFMQP